MALARRGHGWWPYWFPLGSFLLIGSFTSWFPESIQPWLLPVKVVVPGALFLYYWQQGEYPELRSFRSSGAGILMDVVVGVAGAALWMAPYVVVEEWRPDEAWDPNRLGEDLVLLALGVRCIGYGVVTPVVEELFMRSWLLRYAEVFDRRVDFRDVPIAHFSWRSFLIMTVFFTVGHVPWEWPVCVLWVAGTTAWFYYRRQLGSLVIVHAASNLSIFAVVLATSWGTDARMDLWFFL